jgi:hypothetical protein
MFTIPMYPLFRWLAGGGRAPLQRITGWLSRPFAIYLLPLFFILIYNVLFDPLGLLDEDIFGWPIVIYLSLLIGGFIYASDPRLAESIRKLRWISLVIGAAATTAYLITDEVSDLAIWFSVLAILGFGVQHLKAGSPRLAYANEAVLPFYILHQTVLILLGYFVMRWQIADPLKWLINSGVSFGIVIGLYEFLIRRNNVLRFLFGMKALPPKPALTSQPAATR